MTGGRLYVHDPDDRLPRRLNVQLVAAHRPAAHDLALVRELVARHLRYTGSERASYLLARWDEELPHWWCVATKGEVAELQSAYEGTAAGP
jgi:glutamate synthase domain-containing protein 3